MTYVLQVDPGPPGHAGIFPVYPSAGPAGPKLSGTKLESLFLDLTVTHAQLELMHRKNS